MQCHTVYKDGNVKAILYTVCIVDLKKNCMLDVNGHNAIRYMGKWRHSSIILDFSTRWRRVDDFMPLMVYCRGIIWIGGRMYLRATLCVAEKKKILHLPGTEPQQSSPQPIIVQNELSQFSCYKWRCHPNEVLSTFVI